MADKEIEKLAREYAEWLHPEEVALMEQNDEAVDAVEECEAEFITALGFILRDHCIVGKSEVHDEYQARQ